jgi:[ribosomal protein S5]-alanine N-acetyltransferase
MLIDAGICTLRPWRESDIEQLAQIANDKDVARYMADRFPHPYTEEDARFWISLHRECETLNNFAIEVNGVVAGGIGMDPLEGERRLGAQFGYWLGREYWGKGIATAACAAFTDYVLNERAFLRLEASVYAPNQASMRVLEKCGYTCEGIMRKAIVKHGEILDAHLYAKVSVDV